MRIFCEVMIAAALIAMAWNKPFSEWITSDLPREQPSGRAPARQAAPGATLSSGDWMWDPERKSALDRPAYNQTRTFSNHIPYVDTAGREYWIDATGKRHYER